MKKKDREIKKTGWPPFFAPYYLRTCWKAGEIYRTIRFNQRFDQLDQRHFWLCVSLSFSASTLPCELFRCVFSELNSRPHQLDESHRTVAKQRRITLPPNLNPLCVCVFSSLWFSLVGRGGATSLIEDTEDVVVRLGRSSFLIWVPDDGLSNGFSSASQVFCSGLDRVSLGFHWIFFGFYRISLVFDWVCWFCPSRWRSQQWVFLGFTGFLFWFWSGSVGFSLGSLGFTGFH